MILSKVKPTTWKPKRLVECHRSMVPDVLKAKDWIVLPIIAPGKVQEHRFTAPARIVEDKVVYTDEELGF